MRKSIFYGYTKQVELTRLILYLGSFILLWFGAGLVISSVDHFVKKLHLSSFAFSFFVLGLLTSIPEFAVGLTALAENQPEVFVGNLIGGIPVIFLVIIPILAIFGNGIKINNNMPPPKLLFCFVVILAPSFFVMDRVITNEEAILMIASYIALFFVIERKKGILDAKYSKVLKVKSYSYVDILKLLLGIVLLFITSHIIVDNTLYFANAFSISPFYISLIFLALGTNLPELSLAIRAIISGKKDIAFGDYVGSAAANTFLFGIFTLMHSGEIITVNNFFITFVVLIIGLSIFLFFAKTGHAVTRKEGFILLVLYILFVLIETPNS